MVPFTTPKRQLFFICSDDAYFYFALTLSKQNNRIRSDSRPLEGKEVPSHDQKVLVCLSASQLRPMGFVGHTAAYQKYYFQQHRSRVPQLQIFDKIHRQESVAPTITRLKPV